MASATILRVAEPMTPVERRAWRDTQPTALYRLYDDGWVLLYVGITYDVAERWRHHRRHQPWWPQVVHKKLVWHESRPEAEKAEIHAIVTQEPLHNRMKNWPSYRANYRINWLGDRLREERAVLCTPRRPRAKAKIARVAELEEQLRVLEKHAPQHWSATGLDSHRTPWLMMDHLAGVLGDAVTPLEASRWENDECPPCGVPVPCPVVKSMGDEYRAHPLYCL